MKGKISITLLSLVIGIFAVSSFAFGQIFMTTDDVEKIASKPDWVIVDCRDKKAYEKEHIPGSINLGDKCSKVMRDGTSRVLPVAKEEEILGKAGIDNDKHVVLYSEAKDPTPASVAFWILEYLGHTDKVHFLNGGFETWKHDGKPVTTKEAKLSPSKFKASVVPSRIATTEEILKIAKGEIKDIQVIDSRTAKEYTGYDIRALRGGYIPNTTMNLSHEMTFDKKTGHILPLAVLGTEKFFGKLDKNKRTIALCQTGTRSTLTYMELRAMGFKDPANYDDSWAVYGNSIYPPYPIANEQWLDLGHLIKDINGLKKLMNKLKEEE